MPVIDTRRSTRTIRVIGKCATKGCSAITSALLERTTEYVTSCWPDGGGRRVDSRIVAETILEGSKSTPCGHGATRLSTVQGRETSKPCDSRCINGRSGACECSCAGKNHGAGHAG